MPVSIRIISIKLLFLLIVSIQPLYSKEQPVSISFLTVEEFAKHDGRTVTIRGFLYESPEKLLILAAEPNLKSCCVGSETKRQRQLLVTGDIDGALESSNAVTLEGNLVVALGDSFPYRLERSVVVPQNGYGFGVLGIVVLMLGLVTAYFTLRKTRS